MRVYDAAKQAHDKHASYRAFKREMRRLVPEASQEAIRQAWMLMKK